MILTNYAIYMYPHQLPSHTRGLQFAKGRKKKKNGYISKIVIWEEKGGNVYRRKSIKCVLQVQI